jgi:hypothetical protein
MNKIKVVYIVLCVPIVSEFPASTCWILLLLFYDLCLVYIIAAYGYPNGSISVMTSVHGVGVCGSGGERIAGGCFTFGEDN